MRRRLNSTQHTSGLAQYYLEKDYEKQIKQAVSAVNGQVHLHGFQPSSFTRTLQNKAAISVVPSLWAEPCGLTGLEALAAGSALITTNAGGIPEYASGRAVIINLNGTERDDQNAEVAFKNALAQELHHLINDRELRENFSSQSPLWHRKASYLITTYVIELRASNLYHIYEGLLRQYNFSFSLKSSLF